MAKIIVNANGALVVEGVDLIVDSTGRPFDTGGRPKVALCRCGASSNKPFCDATHRRCGFTADDTAPRRPGTA